MNNSFEDSDILDFIDLNKINQSDKKKRGRPKKVEPNSILASKPKNISFADDNVFDEEEIILHLPLGKNDFMGINMSIEKTSTKVIKTDVQEQVQNVKQPMVGVGVEIKHTENVIQSNNLDPSVGPSVGANISTAVDNHSLFSESNNGEGTETSTNTSVVTSTGTGTSTGIGTNQNFYIKQLGTMIKKLKLENDELKKYLSEIAPMYFTEVKLYPVELKLFDVHNNVLIPKKTNICCWWCTYQFDSLPTYLPEKYSNNSFHVTGCFCSFNCAGAYNLNLADSKTWERYSLLKLLYYMINRDKSLSITDVEINISGPKELLEKFGGPMTIDEYRKNAKILGREYHCLIPPFIPNSMAFEEVTNYEKTKNLNILNSNSKNEMFRKMKANNLIVTSGTNLPPSNPNSVSKHIDDFMFLK